LQHGISVHGHKIKLLDYVTGISYQPLFEIAYVCGDVSGAEPLGSAVNASLFERGHTFIEQNSNKCTVHAIVSPLSTI
jgi:hypothetical protein